MSKIDTWLKENHKDIYDEYLSSLENTKRERERERVILKSNDQDNYYNILLKDPIIYNQPNGTYSNSTNPINIAENNTNLNCSTKLLMTQLANTDYESHAKRKYPLDILNFSKTIVNFITVSKTGSIWGSYGYAESRANTSFRPTIMINEI